MLLASRPCVLAALAALPGTMASPALLAASSPLAALIPSWQPGHALTAAGHSWCGSHTANQAPTAQQAATHISGQPAATLLPHRHACVDCRSTLARGTPHMTDVWWSTGSHRADPPQDRQQHEACRTQPALVLHLQHVHALTPPASAATSQQPCHQARAWSCSHQWAQQRMYSTHDQAPSQPQQQPQQGTQEDAESVWSAPNLLSLSRIAAAPVVAWLILQAHWPWAVALTAVAGATDWADGWLARRLGQPSVLGSYLDPLADKLLVAAVVGALAVQGAAPVWVAGLVIGRDVGIVAAVFLHRWRTLGWRTSGVTRAEFFRVQGSGGAPLMQPLFISKLNTVLQIGLVCSCMTHAWLDLPNAALLHQLELLTAGTTVASMGAYVWTYAAGKLVPPPQQ